MFVFGVMVKMVLKQETVPRLSLNIAVFSLQCTCPYIASLVDTYVLAGAYASSLERNDELCMTVDLVTATARI